MASLSEYGVSPHEIELEILESNNLEMDSVTVNNITLLKENGVNFSLDDFGTGYSSLSYVQKLPLKRLKIAQELIRDIDSSPRSLALVTAAIAIAKGLNLESIAEGVENTGVVKILKDLGCDVVQGYVFARPMTATDAKEYFLRSAKGKVS